MFALADSNNFYVSCERLFNPSLERKPVIVLSSGKAGCTVARSNEAKALGIEMGAPLFKIENLVYHHNVKVLASNFALYGDMSQRLMSVLQTFSPKIEIYSIDEAFLDFSYSTQDLTTYAKDIRKTVNKSLGLPISIGIAYTKTLAKVASKIAKHQNDGVYLLKSQDDYVLKNFPVQDIWGVGQKLGKSLREQGIYTAYDFKNLDPRLVRKKYTVVGERILRELNGVRCLSLEEISSPKKSMQVSRSFGRKVTTYDHVKEAIATHLSQLGENLRREGLVTGYVSIYSQSYNDVHKSAFKLIDPPTNDTGTLLKLILPLVDAIFQKGVPYKKTGVMANDLRDNTSCQQQMFEPKPEPTNLSQTLDSLNRRFGKGTIKYAACGIEPKQPEPKRSPNYTTDWSQLITVS